MSKKGGYVIVDLKGQSITAGTPFTLDGVTARLDRAKNKACLLSGFAIGGEEKRDVFVDLQKTEDGYVALFGQYTMTIEDDEITIVDGGILMDNIVDDYGRKRFVEDDAEIENAVAGVTMTYGKWSLSGTHLMLVVAGTVDADSSIPNNKGLFSFVVPKWIYDKALIIRSNFMDFKSLVIQPTSEWTAVNISAGIVKYSNKFVIQTLGEQSTTITKDSLFRIQFDLLIDSAE